MTQLLVPRMSTCGTLNYSFCVSGMYKLVCKSAIDISAIISSFLVYILAVGSGCGAEENNIHVFYSVESLSWTVNHDTILYAWKVILDYLFEWFLKYSWIGIEIRVKLVKQSNTHLQCVEAFLDGVYVYIAYIAI